MKTRKRIYDAVLVEHLAEHRQMALVSGPRQVGKTTTCRNHADNYTNWDNIDDRELVLAGPSRLVEWLGLSRLSQAPPTVLFDELHKYPLLPDFRLPQLSSGSFRSCPEYRVGMLQLYVPYVQATY